MNKATTALRLRRQNQVLQTIIAKEINSQIRQLFFFICPHQSSYKSTGFFVTA
jgi:hypothetical protein